MIEPTRTANPAGYVMGEDFVRTIERAMIGRETPGDFDHDNAVDQDDLEMLRESPAQKIRRRRSKRARQ